MGIWQTTKKIFSRKTSESTVDRQRSALFAKGNVRVDDDTAMKVAAFHRGLIYISSQMAKLPWDVKDKDNNKLNGTPIANLINLAPNEEMNSFIWRLCMVQNAIVHGNAYSEIERNNKGEAIAIWPLPSRDVCPVRTVSGALVYRITGLSSADHKGGTLYLQPRDVYHLKNFHTKDGVVGQGLVAFAIETLKIALSADQMAGGIFANGGIPSGVLSHPGKLSDEAYKRLKKSWEDGNAGRKSGGTAILEEAMKYEAINLDPDVLQFIESRQFGVLEMARFFGLPPTKLFDNKGATFSNVENANLEVATDTLDAWAANLEMEADIKILNNRYGGRYSELDLKAYFRGDMKTRSGYYKDMMSMGSITPNQIREEEGYPGYGKEGDNYYIATNNFTPVDRMDEVIDSQIAKNSQPATPAPASDPNKDKLTTAAIEFLSK